MDLPRENSLSVHILSTHLTHLFRKKRGDGFGFFCSFVYGFGSYARRRSQKANHLLRGRLPFGSVGASCVVLAVAQEALLLAVALHGLRPTYGIPFHLVRFRRRFRPIRSKRPTRRVAEVGPSASLAGCKKAGRTFWDVLEPGFGAMCVGVTHE